MGNRRYTRFCASLVALICLSGCFQGHSQYLFFEPRADLFELDTLASELQAEDVLTAMDNINKWCVKNIKYVADTVDYIPHYLTVLYNKYSDCDGTSYLSMALLYRMGLNGYADIKYLSVFNGSIGHSVCLVVIPAGEVKIYSHISNWAGVRGGYTSLNDMIEKSIYDNWTHYVIRDFDLNVTDTVIRP